MKNRAITTIGLNKNISESIRAIYNKNREIIIVKMTRNIFLHVLD